MKVLHENSYRYLGASGKWHVFESIRESFDPELLYLYRARFVMNDGTSKFFDPIRLSDHKFNLTYQVKGITSDHQEYCIPIDVYRDELNLSDCVRKPVNNTKCVSRNERIAKDSNLVKVIG